MTDPTPRELIELKKWCILQAKDIVQIDKEKTTNILTKAQELYEWAVKKEENEINNSRQPNL